MNLETQCKVKLIAELETMLAVDPLPEYRYALTVQRDAFYRGLSSNWEATLIKKEVAKAKNDLRLLMQCSQQDLTEADVSELTTQALRMNRYLFEVAKNYTKYIRPLKAQTKLFYKFTPAQWEHYIDAVNTRFSKALPY